MKFKLISMINDKGSGIVNEDIAYFNENFAYVIDGATGLNGKNLISDTSDARWFVDFWDEYLKASLNSSKSILDIVKLGIDKVYDKYFASVNKDLITKLDLPSAAIAIVRIYNNSLEYFILGDCTIVIKNDDKLKFIVDNRLAPFDNKIFKKMRKIKDDTLDHNQLKSLLMDDIVANRLKKNTEDGYWILGFDKDAVYNAVYGTYNLSHMEELAIMTDGFGAIVEKYHLLSSREAFSAGIENAIKKLRDFEKSDIDGKQVPRFKIMDDATCIHLMFVDKS